MYETPQPAANDLIVQVARTGKFLEFSNSLVEAYPADYAQLTGRGGKEHAPNGVIRMTITDYTASTKQKNGGKGQTVTCFLEPYLFDIWEEIALRNIGEVYSPSMVNINNAVQVLGYITRSLTDFFGGLRDSCRQIFGGATAKDSATSLGVGVANALQTLAQANNAEIPQMGPSFCDYETLIQRTSLKRGTPYCNVREARIKRSQYIQKQNGQYERMKSPWQINVANFEAKPQPEGTGYLPGTAIAQSRKSAGINISDEEVIKICYHVKSFIRVWQHAMCEDTVRAAIEQKNMAGRDGSYNTGYSQPVQQYGQQNHGYGVPQQQYVPPQYGTAYTEYTN